MTLPTALLGGQHTDYILPTSLHFTGGTVRSATFLHSKHISSTVHCTHLPFHGEKKLVGDNAGTRFLGQLKNRQWGNSLFYPFIALFLDISSSAITFLILKSSELREALKWYHPSSNSWIRTVSETNLEANFQIIFSFFILLLLYVICFIKNTEHWAVKVITLNA